MNFGYFLGGAILGAAGLTAAALIDEKLNPKPSPPDPEEARSMTVERVTSGLSTYCARAAALNSKALEYPLCGWDNVIPMMDFADDSWLNRIRNRIGDGICSVDRQIKLSALRNFLDEADKLYKQHHCLFVRANVILQEHGRQGVRLKNLSPRQRTFTLNNSVSNDSWFDQYNDSLEVVQDFITATIEVAFLLCEKLKALAESKTANDLPKDASPATV